MSKRIRGVYKRGEIYWIRFTDTNGKEVRESTHSRNKKDAEKLRAKRLTEVMEGKNHPSESSVNPLSFSQLAERYLEYCSHTPSYALKKSRLRTLSHFFTNLQSNALNVSQLEQCIKHLRSQGLSPATINRYRAIISHMYSKAVDWNIVPMELLLVFKKVPPLKEKNQRLRFLSSEEAELLLSNAAPHLQVIMYIALNTGMRKGEILSLKWENIDL